MNNDFLQTLKPGDEVIVNHQSPYIEARIGIVARVTKTLIILTDGARFNKITTRALFECTPEAKRKVLLKKYRYELYLTIQQYIGNNHFRTASAKTYERVAEAMGIDYKQIAKDCGYEENEA